MVKWELSQLCHVTKLGYNLCHCFLFKIATGGQVMDKLESRTCDALREYLRTNSLPTSGKKTVLVQR